MWVGSKGYSYFVCRVVILDCLVRQEITRQSANRNKLGIFLKNGIIKPKGQKNIESAKNTQTTENYHLNTLAFHSEQLGIKIQPQNM